MLSSENSTMVRKSFKIYIVQLTGKFILWIFFSLGMFWSLILHVEQSLYKFSPQKLILHEKHFFEKISLSQFFMG